MKTFGKTLLFFFGDVSPGADERVNTRVDLGLNHVGIYCYPTSLLQSRLPSLE